MTTRTVRRSDRMSAILAALTDAGTVQVGDLARSLGVSEATLRRDLAELRSVDAAAQGLPARPHLLLLDEPLALFLPIAPVAAAAAIRQAQQ